MSPSFDRRGVLYAGVLGASRKDDEPDPNDEAPPRPRARPIPMLLVGMSAEQIAAAVGRGTA